MGKLRIRCQPRRSSNWIYLDALGDVTGLKYSRVGRWPSYSGPLMASWRWAYDPSVTPGFMRRGAKVEIVDDGYVCWGGVMAEPRRGTPHELTAYGFGREASGRVSVVENPSIPGTFLPSWNVDEVVDYAIALRGLPWHRFTSLGSVTRGADEKDPVYIDQLLDRAAAGVGKVWHVDEQGIVRLLGGIAEAYGTKPPIGLLPGDDVRMGTADPDYVSAIYGYFTFDNPPAGGTLEDMAVRVVDDAAESRWGVRDEWIDYRKWGPLLLSAGVSADLGNRLALTGARMQFTDAVTGNVDSLRLLGAGPIRVTAIREGMTLRIFDVLDSTGTMHLGASTDVTIGEVEVDADSMTATLKPMGFTPRDLSGILADPTGPRPDARGRVIEA